MSTKNSCQSYKVVLIGESGVGKTSIISRYISDSFDSECMTTTGASFSSKTIFFDKYNKNVKFEIWDTAGQEKYKALTKLFYKDAAVAMWVYDITRKESFEELKNYWYKEVKDLSTNKKCVLVICANKSDWFMTEKVSEQEARDFSKSVNALFKQTSAKSAEGVDDWFWTVGSRLLDPEFIEEERKDSDNNDQQKEQGKNVKIGAGNLKNKTKSGCC